MLGRLLTAASAHLIALLAVACQAGTPAGSATSEPEPGRWHALPGPPLGSVYPDREGHPAWGTIGPDAVVIAWSGGAFGGGLWVTGGGHRNYGGNEVYALDPVGGSGWRRVTEPSPVRCDDRGCEAAAGAAPLARHTFDGLAWLPRIERLWLGGGLRYRPDGRDEGRDSWLLDPATGRWERLPDLPFPALTPCTAYDPVTGLLIVWGDEHLTAFDPERRDYVRLPRETPRLGAGTAAVDSGRRLVVALDASGVWAAPIGPDGPLAAAREVTAAAGRAGAVRPRALPQAAAVRRLGRRAERLDARLRGLELGRVPQPRGAGAGRRRVGGDQQRVRPLALRAGAGRLRRRQRPARLGLAQPPARRRGAAATVGPSGGGGGNGEAARRDPGLPAGGVLPGLRHPKAERGRAYC